MEIKERIFGEPKMIWVVLFEWWETPTICQFHYRECSSLKECDTFAKNLEQLNKDQKDTRWYHYKNIRIVMGDLGSDI